MMFKHFILTRFNLDIYNPNGPYASTVGNDPIVWMNHRIKLFEKYCLPSVQTQSCKDFTWIIAFDPETDPAVISKYDYLDNVEICYEQPHEYLRKKQPEAEWVITTRIDNDDRMHPNFVKRIQERFNHKTKIVDVDYYAYDIFRDAYYTSGRPRNNSMYLSLIEPWTHGIVTAMGHHHSTMPDYYETEKIETVLVYQTLHGRNIANKINGIRV